MNYHVKVKMGKKITERIEDTLISDSCDNHSGVHCTLSSPTPIVSIVHVMLKIKRLYNSHKIITTKYDNDCLNTVLQEQTARDSTMRQQMLWKK
jgi:hypothetical protein